MAKASEPWQFTGDQPRDLCGQYEESHAFYVSMDWRACQGTVRVASSVHRAMHLDHERGALGRGEGGRQETVRNRFIRVSVCPTHPCGVGLAIYGSTTFYRIKNGRIIQHTPTGQNFSRTLIGQVLRRLRPNDRCERQEATQP